VHTIKKSHFLETEVEEVAFMFCRQLIHDLNPNTSSNEWIFQDKKKQVKLDYNHLYIYGDPLKVEFTKYLNCVQQENILFLIKTWNEIFKISLILHHNQTMLENSRMIGQWQNILYFNGSTLQTMKDKVYIVIADLFGGSYNAVFSHLHPNKKN